MNNATFISNYLTWTKNPTLTTSSLQKLIFLTAFLQLLGQFLENSHLISLKPVPIILMIIMSVYCLETDPNITKGLIFGLIGDLCLMFPTTVLFEAGAVSFILGHMCYVRAFTKNYEFSIGVKKWQEMVPHLGGLTILGILGINSFLLWEYLPNKGLFMLYGIFLSSMTGSSFYRSEQGRLTKYWMGIVGGLMFMTSDYIIAYSKFMGCSIELRGFVIMVLYYGGQYMILRGNSGEREKLGE